VQRTLSVWLGFALATALAAFGAQAASVSLDDVRSGDTFVSGNGKLEFSDFDFDSSGDVDEDDIVLEILDDGLRLSGPEGVHDDGKLRFEVSYTVTALDPTMPISGATLELESIVNGDPFAGVLATKKLLASDRDSDWSHSKSWSSSSWSGSSGTSSSWKSKGRDDDDDRWDDDRKSRNRGLGKGHDKGRGKGHEKARGKGHQRRHDDDDDDDDRDRPDREDVLAILEAYDIEVGRGCHDDDDEDCFLEGRNPFDETEFEEPVDWIRVVDGVTVFSWGDGNARWVSSTNRFPVVPEPSSAGLLGLGILALAASRRRGATRSRTSARREDVAG
jgi:hypothetical protein